MKIIKIEGTLRLRGQYTVELDMTEEQFDELSSRQQKQLIEENVDWRNWLDNADLDDLDIDDLEEVNE